MALSSQVSTLEGEGLTTLPLKKFSFVTTPTSQGKLLWTHLPQRDNLFAIFDFTTSRDLEGLTVKKRFLRFARGSEVLEEINLAELVYQARHDVNVAESQSQPISDAQRVMIIIAKEPIIALRYQLPNGMIRRLQVNFDPTSGYHKALEVLDTLSLPIENRDVESQNQRASGSDPDRSLAAQPAAPVGVLPTQSSSVPRVHTSKGRLGAGIAQSTISVLSSAEARPGAVDTTRRSLFQREIAEARRPVTAPTPPSHDTLSQLLPPKRILPFPDPPAKSNRQRRLSEDIRSRSNVLSGENAITKKQKTSKGASAKKKAGIEGGPSGNSMAPPSSSAPIMNRKDVNLSIRTSANGHAMSGDLKPPGALEESTEAQDKLAGSKLGKPVANEQIATFDQGGNGLEKANKDVGVLVSADWVAKVNAFMDHSNERVKEGGIQDAFTTDFKDRVNDFMETHGNCFVAGAPAHLEPSGLTEFTKLPEKERSAVMDALIVECLNDDEMICLVDEVDKSWQRVGWTF